MGESECNADMVSVDDTAYIETVEAVLRGGKADMV